MLKKFVLLQPKYFQTSSNPSIIRTSPSCLWTGHTLEWLLANHREQPPAPPNKSSPYLVNNPSSSIDLMSFGQLTKICQAVTTRLKWTQMRLSRPCCASVRTERRVDMMGVRSESGGLTLESRELDCDDATCKLSVIAARSKPVQPVLYCNYKIVTAS